MAQPRRTNRRGGLAVTCALLAAALPACTDEGDCTSRPAGYIKVMNPDHVIASITLEQTCADQSLQCIGRVDPGQDLPNCTEMWVFTRRAGTCALRIRLINGDERLFTTDVVQIDDSCGSAFTPKSPVIAVSIGDAGPDASDDGRGPDAKDAPADLSTDDGVFDSTDDAFDTTDGADATDG